MVNDAAPAIEHIGPRIRLHRERLQMSVRSLAKACGFSASFISQVEREQASPSIASMEKIATALGMSLSGFFATETIEQGMPIVVRVQHRRELASGWSQATLQMLGPTDQGNSLESIMITLAPRGRSGSRQSGHVGEEFAIVFSGEVSITLGDESYCLHRGDTISYSAETPHQWENVSGEPTEIVLVSSRTPR